MSHSRNNFAISVSISFIICIMLILRSGSLSNWLKYAKYSNETCIYGIRTVGSDNDSFCCEYEDHTAPSVCSKSILLSWLCETSRDFWLQYASTKIGSRIIPYFAMVVTTIVLVFRYFIERNSTLSLSVICKTALKKWLFITFIILYRTVILYKLFDAVEKWMQSTSASACSSNPSDDNEANSSVCFLGLFQLQCDVRNQRFDASDHIVLWIVQYLLPVIVEIVEVIAVLSVSLNSSSVYERVPENYGEDQDTSDRTCGSGRGGDGVIELTVSAHRYGESITLYNEDRPDSGCAASRTVVAVCALSALILYIILAMYILWAVYITSYFHTAVECFAALLQCVLFVYYPVYVLYYNK